MSIVEHAKREFAIVGGTEEDEYDGLLFESVIKLLEVFASQGHSGYSAYATANLFMRMIDRETLSPLTSDPSEWSFIPEEMSGTKDGLWQNIRNSRCFSADAGRTFWNVEEKMAAPEPDLVPVYVTEDKNE